MIFGQVVKNILDKHQEVWIPTIGLLAYDKATSKLGLDVYGSGNDQDIIHLISEIKQVSYGEARGILIQEVEAIKSSIKEKGNYAIDGLGEISWKNGSYLFEPKKALFPTNFFGENSFNPTIFQDNTKKEPIKNTFENTFIKVEPKVVTPKETPKVEKIVEPISPKIEPVEEKKHIAEVSTPKDLFDATVNEKKEVEPIVQDIVVPEPTIVEKDTEVENLNSNNTEFTHHEEDVEIIEEKIPTYDLNITPVELEPEPIEESIYEEPIKEVRQLVIDEPRRNIGKAKYDEGYYDFDLTLDDSNQRKWGLVGLLAIGVLALGFFIPWIIASSKGSEFLGLAPLWSSKKPENIVKKDPIIPTKVDSTIVDSTKLITKATDTIAKSIETTISNQNTTNNTASKAASNTATTPTTKSSIATTIQTKNTPPKTPSTSLNTSKKTLAVATTKIEKTNGVVTTQKEAASLSTKNNISDSSSKSSASTKNQKINVIGKPYATANYTKGNYYLSFGKFKVPSAATKLKRDMKTRAGVETDIILIDGTYRVVIPYLSKDKAEAASKDYVSTTLFE